MNQQERAEFYRRGLAKGEYTVGDLVMMLARAEIALEAPCPECGADTIATDTIHADTIHADTTECPPEGPTAGCDAFHRKFAYLQDDQDPLSCPECGEKL